MPSCTGIQQFMAWVVYRVCAGRGPPGHNLWSLILVPGLQPWAVAFFYVQQRELWLRSYHPKAHSQPSCLFPELASWGQQIRGRAGGLVPLRYSWAVTFWLCHNF